MKKIILIFLLLKFTLGYMQEPAKNISINAGIEYRLPNVYLEDVPYYYNQTDNNIASTVFKLELELKV